MIHQTKAWALPVIAALGVFWVFALGWSYFLHNIKPVDFISGSIFVPDAAKPGDRINLCRDFYVNRDVTLRISRDWVSELDTGIMTVDHDATTVHRKTGPYHQCRVITVPALQAGVWRMNTYLTYSSWPFWTSTYDAPVVVLTVK